MTGKKQSACGSWLLITKWPEEILLRQKYWKKCAASFISWAMQLNLGLKGTKYHDRILGSQSPQFKEKMDAGKLIGGETNNRIIMYVSAMMEVKSSMGVIVAAPTAGSCGALPGRICFGTAHSMQLHEDEIVKAMVISRIDWCVHCSTCYVCCRGRRLYGRNRFRWWYGCCCYRRNERRQH